MTIFPSFREGDVTRTAAFGGIVAAMVFAASSVARAQEPPAGEPPAQPAPPTSEPAPPPAAPVEAPPAESSGDPTPPATVAPPTNRLTALPPPPPPEDDLPIPTLTIDRIPPNTSFEFAVEASFGEVAYFRDQVPPWVGFGLRGGWGKNFGINRLGFAASLTAEGDVGVHTQLGFEPELAWDLVSSNNLLVGLGVSPALIYTQDNATVETETAFRVAPTASARLGWSQTWSRVGRRLFLFLEPKVRMVDGGFSPQVAVGVGSGGGR